MDTPSTAGIHRLGVFAIVCLAAFCVCTCMHEWTARRAGAMPNLVDDESLWSIQRMKVDAMGPDDIVLLGASRMGTDLDKTTLAAGFPGRKIVNLAISGKQTSLPVFADMVRKSPFAGIVLIDETEYTLPRGDDQQSFVDSYRRDFTFDRRINRTIETWLQERLVCVGFGQSSTKLLLSLLVRRRVPARAYALLDADRFIRSHFDWIRPDLLADIRRKKMIPPSSTAGPEESRSTAIARWKPLVDAFRERGGRVVFIRLPVGAQRWQLENVDGRAASSWNDVMNGLDVPSIHCDLDEELGRVECPDASHLDAKDISAFTTALIRRLEMLQRDPVDQGRRSHPRGESANGTRTP